MNNKILRQTRRLATSAGFSLLFCYLAGAQDIPMNRYGLRVVSTPRQFRALLRDHPGKNCLPLSGIPGLLLDLRYATRNNFTLDLIYPDDPEETYLRQAPAKALDSVAAELATLGYGLLIFDAYRPYHITEELWARVRDDRYAADPAKGSGHNRGVAVDLTLYSLATRQMMTMPTGFDNFSDSAHQDFIALPDSIITHRELLKKAMVRYGFIPLPTEWWHFSWPAPTEYELLDLSFQQMERLAAKPVTADR